MEKVKNRKHLLSATFYGVSLDKNDPYLRHNLNRLEDRFRARFYSSFQKYIKRRQQGKIPHVTTVKSIEENKSRFQKVRMLRHILLNEELNLSMKSKVKNLKEITR